MAAFWPSSTYYDQNVDRRREKGSGRFARAQSCTFFRREDDGGILIVRILHAAMLPELYSFDDVEDQE